MRLRDLAAIPLLAIFLPATPARADTLNFDGNVIQTYTILADGLYDITAYGAEGGDVPSASETGGLGAEIGGEFDLLANEVLSIAVGGIGASSGYEPGGGGGGTFVIAPGGVILVIAGGGGGANEYAAGDAGQTGTSGDSGGGGASAGSAGSGGSSGGQAGGGGGGGYLTNGGTGACPYPGQGGGSYESGALGGAPGGSGCGSSDGPLEAGGFGGGGGGGGEGGGGGGGYSGGAGGTVYPGGYGGGGGSYDSGLDQVLVPGENVGVGYVTITVAAPEPSSFVLLAAGFVLLAGAKRRFAKAAHSR